MDSEPLTKEFLSLIKSTREQLAYFRELGVRSIETKYQPDSASKKTIPDVSADLRQPLLSVSLNRVEAGVAASGDLVRTILSKQQPASTPPIPADTLFGDLSPAPVTIQKSSESFEQIWSDIGECTRCPLYQGRTNIVHTEGNRQARLMFVGEAPGADEDAQARPFVGRAGQLLTRIIEAIGFKREEVLIGNVNRCRPPGNRPPTPEEASICKPFLLREIAAVQPEVIVVLGNTAMRNLLDIKQGITRVRGQFQDYQGVKVMPTFHPAYLLRDPSKKQQTWEDLKKVRDYLDTTPRRER
ncbi:MAG: uracil-DNA glycosylase [Acidobacteriota bacterium]|nr:uracil-DNA glycosylase [Acidobacteriota bacterium]